MLTPSDVMDSPLIAVLCELETAGVRFRLLDGAQVQVSPAGRLTEDQRALFRRYPDDLRLLVSIATDEGLQLRRDAFRLQCEAAAHDTLPTFLFVPGIPYAPGSCFSCGDAVPELRFSRCWRCSIGLRLAARLPIPADLATGLCGAKRIA